MTTPRSQLYRGEMAYQQPKLSRLSSDQCLARLQDQQGVPEQCCTLDLSVEAEQRLVLLFKALGNSIRFEILKFLLTHPGCITGELVDHLPIAQATVSQHLKVLRETGWVEGTIQGPATRYCLNESTVRWFRDRVADVF